MGPTLPSNMDIQLPMQSGLYTNLGLSVNRKNEKMIPENGGRLKYSDGKYEKKKKKPDLKQD